MARKTRIAVVGLRFGESFARIYQAHPDVEYVGLCDINGKLLSDVAGRLGIGRVHADLREVVESSGYDAVHVVTTVSTHADLCLRVMRAGKHCACAVPMGLGIGELQEVHETQRRTGVSYMMMETALYSRDYLYAKDLCRSGQLGRIQFLRGCHAQDLNGYPPVWNGFPPMWYITHAIAPLLALADSRAVRVHCLGTGTGIECASTAFYAHPVPMAVALFRLQEPKIAMEITRSLFDVAPYGDEGFSVWGSEATFVAMGETALVRRAPADARGLRHIDVDRNVTIPYRPELLPPSLAPFAKGGHGGSHPHLAHEFIRSVIEGRAASIDATRAANWCAPGICAHQSMLREGEGVDIPAIG